jgi:succinate dehydrogenase / fumarate reductase membrane anchor subunit
MAFLTDRKRALGLGASKTGTEHFWHMQVSSVALAILVPLFVITFGRILGAPHDVVVAHFSRPFPAIVTGLTLVVGFLHFRGGAQVMIEDYTQGGLRRALVIAVTCLSWGAIAAGLFALVRLAL